MVGMPQAGTDASPKIRVAIKILVARKRLVASTTEEGLIADKDVIARMHRNIDLPFPPFPGLHIRLGKDKNLTVSSVLYDDTTGSTEVRVDAEVVSTMESVTLLPELLKDGWLYD